ncbi:hypothetical protein A1O7_04349 [Cladophialophora yegresii CBS 114405]|uniref:Zinc finger PHD-type domain-containing protein n=1 Tax=Cladophialophora yegresii CBS 114405 TaxID=1182544 RepID=W9VWI5_9EURO|nr:uncharacterized protein A1O7_04349 [Cladophialophora yegresii CBS 114405]EXJ60197.1 hypothetical protein A1O7_04349 [Cladophialophora yegresii CBS 114405]
MPPGLRERLARVGKEDNKDGTGRPKRQSRVPDRFGQASAASGDLDSRGKRDRLDELKDNTYQPSRRNNRVPSKDISGSERPRPRTRRQRLAAARQTPKTTNSREPKSTGSTSESSYDEAPADEVLSFLMQIEPGTLPADFDIRTFLAAAPKKKVKKHPSPPPDIEPMLPNLSQLAKEPVPTAFQEPHDQIWMAGLVWLHHVLQEGKAERRTPQRPFEDVKRWCLCPRGDVKGWSGSVQCEDLTCSITWYHWECLTELDQVLAQKYQTWACLRCLFQRALQFFTHFLESWLNGVTGLEHTAITNRLQKVVDEINLTVEC